MQYWSKSFAWSPFTKPLEAYNGQITSTLHGPFAFGAFDVVLWFGNQKRDKVLWMQTKDSCAGCTLFVCEVIGIPHWYMWHLTSRKGMGQLHNNYCTSQSNTGKSTSSSVRYIYPSCKEKVVLGWVADAKVKTKNTPAKSFFLNIYVPICWEPVNNCRQQRCQYLP